MMIGCVLIVLQVKDVPVIEWSANPDTFYTVVMCGQCFSDVWVDIGRGESRSRTTMYLVGEQLVIYTLDIGFIKCCVCVRVLHLSAIYFN